MLLATGLRVSEMIVLDVADLVRDAHIVRSGKGRKTRTVVLSPRALHALDVLRSGRLEGPLFIARERGRCPRAACSSCSTLARRAGIGHVRPHDLRRSCATSAVAA